MAGIARQQESPAALKSRPFFQYDAINDSRTRPSHAALDNVIAPADSPFWQTHTPPLGYRCRCTRIGLSAAQAKARGYDAAKPLPDVQPDPGFAGHPLADDGWAGIKAAIEARLSQCSGVRFAAGRGGKNLWCNGTGYDYIKALAEAIESDKPMPAPRRLNLDLLSPGLPKTIYLERFMREFGASAGQTAIIKDKTGLHDLALSELLFTNHLTNSSKIEKRGRLPYLLYLAKTINDPDEIRFYRGGYGDAALYLMGSYLVQGETMFVHSVFKHDGKVWTGWTGYPSWKNEHIDGKRAESTGIYLRTKENG